MTSRRRRGRWGMVYKAWCLLTAYPNAFRYYEYSFKRLLFQVYYLFY